MVENVKKNNIQKVFKKFVNYKERYIDLYLLRKTPKVI